MPFCTICGNDTINILDQLDVSDGYTWYCESCDTWIASIEELDAEIADKIRNLDYISYKIEHRPNLYKVRHGIRQ